MHAGASFFIRANKHYIYRGFDVKKKNGFNMIYKKQINQLLAAVQIQVGVIQIGGCFQCD